MATSGGTSNWISTSCPIRTLRLNTIGSFIAAGRLPPVELPSRDPPVPADAIVPFGAERVIHVARRLCQAIPRRSERLKHSTATGDAPRA